MKLIFTCLFISLLCACGMRAHDTFGGSGQTNSNIRLKASIGEIGQLSDPVTISAIRIEGNILFIEVSYSGGCNAHQFEIIGSNMIAKSLPPIRQIQLVHESNNDKCESLIKQTLEIDIKDLAYKQEAGSKIILTLDGWKESIEYVYE